MCGVMGWQVVDYLVDKGTDVNVSDNDKCTPLFYAAYAGTLQPIHTLREPEHPLLCILHGTRGRLHLSL